jgi:hypothetical protein
MNISSLLQLKGAKIASFAALTAVTERRPRQAIHKARRRDLSRRR